MTITDQAGNADATGAVVITPTADNTWEQKTYTLTSTYTNDEMVEVNIDILVDTGDTGDFGDCWLNY